MDSKAIANQKVFVRLEDVLELQKEIERLTKEVGPNQAWGLLRAADILHLPIKRVG